MKAQESHNEEQNDPTWDLLKHASEAKVSPMFSRNVMREIRLNDEVQAPWWKTLLQAKPVWATGAVAACTLLLLPIMLDKSVEPPTQTPVIAQLPVDDTSTELDSISEADLLIEDEDLATEFLIALAESPDVFANEEIFEMIGL